MKPHAPTLHDEIIQDIWTWIRSFVAVRNEFYGGRFPPCPYAQSALSAMSVDVSAWETGDVRSLIRQKSLEMRDAPHLTTRVIAFPPRTQLAFGISEYLETLNAELIPDNIFLNAGISKTIKSRYPGSNNAPYFIVIANSLDAVIKGAALLQRTEYYKDWPRSHFELVVERRVRMASRYGKR